MTIRMTPIRLAVAGNLFLLTTQLSALAAGGGVENSPEKSPTSVIEQDIGRMEPPCNDDVEKRGIGVRSCDVVKKDTKEYLQKVLGHIVYNYYDGKLLGLDQKKGFCVQSRFKSPVCALGNVGASEEDTNRKSESCSGPITQNEGYCKYPIKSDFSNCGREKNWILHGGRVQALQHHLEEVEHELDNNSLNLVDYSANPEQPARMCIGYARAIERLLNGDGKKTGLIFADKYVREKFPAAVLATSIAEACPREGIATVKTNSGRTLASAENSGSSSASLMDSLGITGKLADVFGVKKSDSKNGASNASVGTLEQKKGISSAACHLAFARQNIEVLYSKLAACEVWYRAQKTFHESFERAQGAFAAINNATVQPCLQYARQATNNATDNTSDANFMAKYYECYKGKAAGKKGVKQALKDYFELYAPIENAMPYQMLDKTEESCSTGSNSEGKAT